MKKSSIFIWILVICLCSACFVSCDFRDLQALMGLPLSESEGLAFVSNGDGTCYVNGLGTCTDRDIVIPSVSPDGDKVTGIGDGAFYKSGNRKDFFVTEGVRSITIPEGVISIGEDAFAFNSGIEKITIPNSVTSIGEDAFLWCISLGYNKYDNGKYLGNDENKYMVLVESCDPYITSCEIHSDTKLIHHGAFYANEMLQSLIIPEGVISIGSGAFSSCRRLESVTIPDSVKFMDSNLFAGCEKLTLNEYDNAYYIGSNENPYLMLVKAKDQAITSCEINNATKFIHSWAFCDCESLTVISIPDSVIGIGLSAFENCSNLAKVNIPDGVTRIEPNTFYECRSLVDVIIPNSVTYIGSGAFCDCSALTNVTMSDRVKLIDYQAFAECNNLQTFSIPDSIESIGASAFKGSDNFILNEYKNAYYVGNETNPYLVLLKAKNGIIRSCEINEATEVVAKYAFANCSYLSSIVFPDGVREIGMCVFENCTSLESVVIPDSVTNFDANLFANCDSIKTVYFTGSESEWLNRLSNKYIYNNHLEDTEIVYDYVAEAEDPA